MTKDASTPKFGAAISHFGDGYSLIVDGKMTSFLGFQPLRKAVEDARSDGVIITLVQFSEVDKKELGPSFRVIEAPRT